MNDIRNCFTFLDTLFYAYDTSVLLKRKHYNDAVALLNLYILSYSSEAFIDTGKKIVRIMTFSRYYAHTALIFLWKVDVMEGGRHVPVRRVSGPEPCYL